MDFEEIKQILALVKEHELAEFELAHQDFKIRIRKDTAVQTVVAAPLPIAAVAQAAAPTAAPPSAPVAPAVEEGDELAVVKSPIVGTYYHAPEPGAPTFASVRAV